MNLAEHKIILSTHSHMIGPSQYLRDYLKSRAGLFGYIDHPFSYAKQINSSFSLYDQGDLKISKKALAIAGPDLLFYIKDVLLTLYYVFTCRTIFDLYIGADCLNAFCGLILKVTGRVRKVVFYTIDYVPKRFKNPFLNWIYHFIDRICCRWCDCVWNLSPAMAEAREKDKNVISKKHSPQLVVPAGCSFDHIKRLPLEKINRYSMVFLGHLRPNQGVELLVEVMTAVKIKVPQAKLIIIGSGPLEDQIKNRVSALGLKGQIEFKGLIQDHAEIERILCRCAIGLAPYAPSPSSFTYYADPSKPKAYLACGLPVIITDVPLVARDIAKVKAGLMVKYDKVELSKAIIKLLKDDTLYKEYRAKAISFASLFSWDSIFKQSFEETQKIIDL